MVVEELDKIVEKIKRLASGGNDTDMVCFIVAFDLLYFLNDTDNRNKFVYNYYKSDNSMFSSNLKKVCSFAESILLEDEIYHKMLKNIEMEVRRDQLVSMYNYFDVIDRIEKGNSSARNLITDGFKIRLLKDQFSSSSKDYAKLTSKVSELKNRYDRNMIDIITIIAIFIAIVIGMVSGVSFSLEAFKSISNNNIYDVCLVVSVVGIFLFNIFFCIIKYISRLSGRDIDKYGTLIFVNVIFVLLIVFFIVLRIS